MAKRSVTEHPARPSARACRRQAPAPGGHPAACAPPAGEGSWRLPMAAREPARTVVLRLALALLAGMRGYEDGIARGLDPECLHQYRVLLRRLRSLVTQMRCSLPDKVTRMLRDGLRDLARRTGRLRDLDVLLLAEPAYRRLVPDTLLPQVARAFLASRRLRGLERGRLVQHLRSRRYAILMAELYQAILAALQAPVPGRGQAPIGQLVRKRLRRQYRRILSDAAELPALTPDATYHRIRIHCKRLRYLLDLFRDVFSAEPARVLLRRLQALQQELGAVNDLAVQRAHLEGLLCAGGGAAASPPVLGPVSLGARLDRRRAVLDRRVRALLCRFCSRSTARRIKEL